MKYIYIFIGTLSLLLGIIGIFLPVLPTTPFLLLTAAFYVRGSQRMYFWLMNQKQLGPYIRNFMEYKAIPLRAKVVSVSFVWITMLYVIICVVSYSWLKILLLVLAVAISSHILSFGTLRKEK